MISGSAELQALVDEVDAVLADAGDPRVESVARRGRTLIVDGEPVDAARTAVIGLPPGDEDAAAALLQALAEPPSLGPTEDAQLLVARRRRDAGIGLTAAERIARKAWRALPERARRRLRPLVVQR